MQGGINTMLANRFFRITNMKSLLPGAYREDGPCAGGTFWAFTDKCPHWIEYYLLHRADCKINYKTIDQAFSDYEIHARVTNKIHPYSDWIGGEWVKIDRCDFDRVIKEVSDEQLVNIEFYLIRK